MLARTAFCVARPRCRNLQTPQPLCGIATFAAMMLGQISFGQIHGASLVCKVAAMSRSTPVAWNQDRNVPKSGFVADADPRILRPFVPDAGLVKDPLTVQPDPVTCVTNSYTKCLS